MNLAVFGSLAGGIGLFLLGMRLMTDGLKYAAGSSLKSILQRSTSTRVLGIFSGVFLTSLVQSSSAVTVATIGFVNAGLMDLGHAISIIYGSNIGTTVTGWLVSLIGFKLHIKAFALPFIGFGMLLRVVKEDSRWGSLGDVLSGFGIFFLGIEILKNNFSGIGNAVDLGGFAGDGAFALFVYVGVGFLLTCCMQSSSAAIALVLTAVATKILPYADGAAMIIGANVGTTSTAALSVIGATINAKRLAWGHVIFNIVTGVVALAILHPILWAIDLLMNFYGSAHSDITRLALFHTVFNILGVGLFFPFTNRFVAILERWGMGHEKDDSRSRFLDDNIVSTPALAMHAIAKELISIGTIARHMAQGAISAEVSASPRLRIDKENIQQRITAVWKFVNRLQRENLPAEFDDQIPLTMRVAGYYNDMTELALDLATIPGVGSESEHPLGDTISLFKRDAVRLLKEVDPGSANYCTLDCHDKLEEIKDEYRSLKNKLLQQASRGNISASQLVANLDMLSRIRRIVEQAEKAGRYLGKLEEFGGDKEQIIEAMSYTGDEDRQQASPDRGSVQETHEYR